MARIVSSILSGAILPWSAYCCNAAFAILSIGSRSTCWKRARSSSLMVISEKMILNSSIAGVYYTEVAKVVDAGSKVTSRLGYSGKSKTG